MSYQELLSTINWKYKRKIIIEKDSYKCKNCDNRSYFKNSLLGDVRTGTLTGQVVDTFDKKLFIKNIYRISFVESNITYFFSEGKSKPIYESSFNSYNYYTSQELTSFKVLYEKIDSNLLLTGVANDCVTPFIWVYVRNLHVHHKYYQEGKKPWQYPNDALVTLCWTCHEELHKNSKVRWLDEKGVIIGQLTPCKRCHGAGYIPKYSHVENGVCFECFGERFDEFKKLPQKRSH